MGLNPFKYHFLLI